MPRQKSVSQLTRAAHNLYVSLGFGKRGDGMDAPRNGCFSLPNLPAPNGDLIEAGIDALRRISNLIPRPSVGSERS